MTLYYLRSLSEHFPVMISQVIRYSYFPVSITSNDLNTHQLANFIPNTDVAVFMKSCKWAGAKIRPHIFILTPACLPAPLYFFYDIAQSLNFSNLCRQKFQKEDILYFNIQWGRIK